MEKIGKKVSFNALGPRALFPMISLHGKIYILGGLTDTSARSSSEVTSSVLVSTAGTIWEETTPLDTARGGHSAVIVQTFLCD